MPIELVYGLGLAILVVAFAYGLYRSRSRNRANDAVREEATRQLYDEPERYAAGGQDELKQRLKPES